MLTGLLIGANLLLVMQSPQASLAGTVTDGVSGESLRDAVVALSDLNRTTLTDSRGNYSFRSVPAGPQHVSVRRLGYQPRTVHAIVPSSGELSINITLHRLPVLLGNVQIFSPPEIRGVEPNDRLPFGDRRISAAAVRNHPMLAEPDGFLALGGGEVQMRPESPSGINIRGGATDQAAYLLDGIPVLSPYHAAGTFSAFNTDALERLEISAAFPPPVFPDALSGVVNALTRAPSTSLQIQGGVSTTHSRITVDGPLGHTPLQYLFSYRIGYPGSISPPKEGSYVKGESGDIIAKVQSPLLGGRITLLGYDASNEFGAFATAEGEAPRPDASARNDFTWKSRTVGITWSAGSDSMNFRLQIWSATSGAGLKWHPAADSSWTMNSRREDVGVLAMFERRRARGVASLGAWVRQGKTSYSSELQSASGPVLLFDTKKLVASAFARAEREIGAQLVANAGIMATSGASETHVNPSLALTWTPSLRTTVSTSVARYRQYAQSLRNPESAASNIFPADLYVAASAGDGGVPVARADQATIAIGYQPGAGQRVGVQMFVRDVHNIVLVAPQTGEPFATIGFLTGSAIASGASLEWAMSRGRYGLLASYGIQNVRVRHAVAEYTPENGTAHVVELGVITFPSSTLSLRVGAALAAGRRATAISGPFEWEACNLLDKGCEFGGSPRADAGSPGGTSLPLYARVDLGLRKHWHVRIAGRDTPIALFGSLTNMVGRANVLNFAQDAATGETVAVTMRPRAPLVVGVDWRY